MIGSSYGIDAQVRILRAVAGDRALGPGESPVLLDSREAGAAAGILSIDVQHSLATPAGRFKIEFAPAASPAARNALLAEIIAPYSLVAIALHRYGPGRDDPATTEAPEPVMLGLVDTVDIAEDFSQPAPARRQSIAGRSLAAILMDHRWYLHRWAQLHRVPADARSFYADPPDLDAAAADELAIQQLGLYAVDEDLYRREPLQHPIDLMARTFDFYVSGTPATTGTDRGPFIRVRFADGTPIASRLRFDAHAARAAFVDPRAQVDVTVQPTLFPQASGWDMLRSFSPPYCNELFAVLRGTRLDEAYVEIVSRKPPWAGEIVYGSAKGPLVGFSTGVEPAMYGQSLFDSARPGWAGWLAETHYIDGSDIISTPQLARGVSGTDRIFTLYEVLPLIASVQGDKQNDQVNQALWPPLVDIDSRSPGYVARYGVRPLRDQLKYIAGLATDAATVRPVDLLSQHAGAYQVLYYTWYKRLADMWRGAYVLKGRTSFRIGTRLVDLSRDPPREYYITGVRHHVAFGPGPEAAAFTTTVQVERGWDLSPGAA